MPRFRNRATPRIAMLATALIACCGLMSPARAVVIDDFSVGDIQLTGSVALQAQTSLDPAHVIGGARHIAIDSSATLAISSDALLVTPSTSLAYFTLMYGYGAPLGVDVLAAGHDRLRLKFNPVAASSAGGIVWISLNSNLPPSSNAPGPHVANVRNGGIIEIPFTQYSANLSTINTVAVRAIRMSGGLSIESISTVGPPLPGDFDRNGVVDAGDLDEFRRTFGRQTIPEEGYFAADENRDRRVDGADFLAWQRIMAETASPASLATTASIPEPSTLALSITFTAAALAHRSRFQQRMWCSHSPLAASSAEARRRQ